MYSGAYHMLGEHKNELKVARLARKYYPDRHAPLGLEIRALAATGKIGEVSRLIEESRRLPPESGADLRSYLFAAGRELRIHGYRKESLEFMERAIQWLKDRPDSERKAVTYRSNMANCLYWAERWEEAKADYEALAKEFPENLGYRSSLGISAARMGNREEAQRISDELGKVEQPYLYGLIPYYQARIAALLGEKDKAVKLLQESVIGENQRGSI
jgi:tetratricopeptide (TPR) repeat protein